MAEQAFTWNAADYAEQSTGQKIWADELIAKLSLSGSEHILDLGCGDGKISFALAENVPQGQVVGIDSSENMIQLAQACFVEPNNISFQKSNVMDFAYNESFDVIFSNAVLHWLKDHVRVLKNCYKSLQQGGKLLLQMGGEGNGKEFIAVINEVMQQEKWTKYFSDFIFPFSFYSVENYKIWLPNCGFVAKRIELINKDIQHKGKEGLAGYFRTAWMPYTSVVFESEREEFINDVVERYLAKYPMDSDGNTHINMVRLEVEAIKV